MPAKLLVFTRSTPQPTASSQDCRQTSAPGASKTILSKTSNNSSHSHGYNGGSGGNGYYSARQGGRGGGGYGNRYGGHDGDRSAASLLRLQLNNGHHPQSRHNKSVPVFSATAGGASRPPPAPSDRQVFSEPATIVWCEGGIGEVMSPTVWRLNRLHLYFDASKTKMDLMEGWAGLRSELESGMELDVTFSMTYSLHQKLQAAPPLAAAAGAAVDQNGERHTFICIEKLADPRVPSSHSVRTAEQAVVIARRATGAAFLINNSGERSVLHPNFLPIDAVRDAILEKTDGPKIIHAGEIDSPSALCALGRSLSVRLAPAPSWLPNIYATDRGVTRWALSAEVYGEEQRGRAVVVESSRHSVSLCPVEGPLARRKTTLHAPIIQLPEHIKRSVQEIGSCWRFRACRELPGRAAIWRAFEVTEELDTDAPLSVDVIQSVLAGERLIDVEMEEEEVVIRPGGGGGWLVDIRVEPTTPAVPVLDDLAQLQLVFSQQLQQGAAAPVSEAAPKHDQLAGRKEENEDEEGEVMVFDCIDDIVDSATFAADVFKAPSILPNEWRLLGVPPDEAVRTEQECEWLPRCTAGLSRASALDPEARAARPDMRVHAVAKKKRKKTRRADSAADDDDEDERATRQLQDSSPAMPGALVDSLPQSADKQGTAPLSEAAAAAAEKERKRQIKEDYRMKKHLASIDVKFVAADDDMFDLLHGGEGKPAPSAKEQQPAAFSITAAPAAAAAPVETPPTADRAPSPSALASAPAPSGLIINPRLNVIIGEAPNRPRAPRFQILPYPDRPKHEEGWWFRPTRPRPEAFEETRKERKRRERAEAAAAAADADAASEADEEAAPPPPPAPFVPMERVPIDDMRARLLGALNKKEKAPMAPPVMKTEQPKKEKKEERPAAAGENMLVDLSPASSSSTADSSAANPPVPASSVLQPAQPPMPSPGLHLLHDDLKDLF